MRSHRGFGSAAVVVLLASVAVAGLVVPPPAAAVVIFSDGFEYTDSPANHEWTLHSNNPNPSVVTTSTDYAFAGSRSLRISRSPSGDYQVEHAFGNLVFGTGLSISVKYYDDLASGTNWDNGVNVTFGPQQSVSLVFYNGPNYWYWGSDGVTPFQSSTTITRTVGWHDFTFSVQNNLLDLIIDGTPVAMDVASVSSLDKLTLYVGEPPSGYFDEVVVSSLAPVPEPGTLLLLASGLVGLCAWRRRKT